MPDHEEDSFVALVLILAHQLKIQDSLKSPKITSTGDKVYEALQLIREKKARVLQVFGGV